MSVHNPFSMTFGGDPVVGTVPAQLIVHGNLSDAQRGMVQARYAQFCTTARLSIAPSLALQYALPDGSRMRASSIFGVNSVHVWPVGGEEPYVGIRGIGVTYSDSGGVVWRYILTPGGEYMAPDGTWKTTKVSRVSGGDVFWQSSEIPENYSIYRRATNKAGRLNGLIRDLSGGPATATGLFSHTKDDAQYIAAAYGDSSAMKIEVKKSPALNYINPESLYATSAPIFSGSIHSFGEWEAVAASHDGSFVLARKLGAPFGGVIPVEAVARFRLNGVATPSKESVSFDAPDKSESPAGAGSNDLVAIINESHSPGTWDSYSYSEDYQRSYSWDGISSVSLTSDDGPVFQRTKSTHTRYGSGSESRDQPSDVGPWSSSGSYSNSFSDLIEVFFEWGSFVRFKATASQTYSYSGSGFEGTGSAFHWDASLSGSLSGSSEIRSLMFSDLQYKLLVFVESLQECSATLGGTGHADASSEDWVNGEWTYTHTLDQPQNNNIVVEVDGERILELPVGGDTTFAKDESGNVETRYEYGFAGIAPPTEMSPGFAGMFTIYYDTFTADERPQPAYSLQSAKDPLTGALILHLNVTNTGISNGTHSEWFVFDGDGVKTISDVSKIEGVSKILDSVIPSKIESV
jgi:hypothetical protein